MAFTTMKPTSNRFHRGQRYLRIIKRLHLNKTERERETYVGAAFEDIDEVVLAFIVYSHELSPLIERSFKLSISKRRSSN